MSGILESESKEAEYSVEKVNDGAGDDEKLGTARDKTDMHRLGKLQELRRRFRFYSTTGYAMILGCTWEFALITTLFTLPNGGPAGAIWIFFIACFCFYSVMLSMAEMASIAPTTGGQFHWVSEFAPPKYQKILSFMVGWFCVLAWQSGMNVTAYAVAQQIEGIIALSDPNYTIQGWHGALLTIAVTLLSIFFNTYLIRKLPLVEGIGLALHVLGFLTFVIILWVMGPRGSAHDVFTNFEDNNGWGNVGLATLIGLLSPVATLVGADSVCHLSEELRDASLILPWSMVTTASVNYILAFVMTVTFMFTVGDVNAALNSPTGQPYIEVVYNATQSKGATLVLTVVMMILLLFCAINQVTTSSRQLFAFARDNGLPFSAFLSRVHPGWDIPLNAVIVTLIFTALLSLIIIGSTIAFDIMTSLSGVGLISSYILAIGCIISYRLRGKTLPPSRFSLGRAGLYVNIFAMCFLVLTFVMLFFPAVPDPNAQSMNWTVLIYGAAVIFALVYYYLGARYKWVGPVTYVRKDY